MHTNDTIDNMSLPYPTNKANTKWKKIKLNLLYYPVKERKSEWVECNHFHYYWWCLAVLRCDQDNEGGKEEDDDDDDDNEKEKI